MGGSWSNALSWKQQNGKELQLVVLGMSLPGDNRESLLQLNPKLKETVAKKHRLYSSQADGYDLGGRCSERPVRMYFLSIVDGVIFMLNADEVEKKEEAKLYISTYLENELDLVDETTMGPMEGPPFLFVIRKKVPDGPDEDVSDRDEADDLAVDLGLKDNMKVAWKVVVCRSEASESLSEGLGWLREAIIKRKGDEDDLDVMKLGKASHTSALMQKIKHILSPSLTRA